MQLFDLNFTESQMHAAILKLPPAEQKELRDLAASQSLSRFTHTLQDRFPRYASYITEDAVEHVLAYDRQRESLKAQHPGLYQDQPAPAGQQPVQPASAQPVAQPAPVKPGKSDHVPVSTPQAAPVPAPSPAPQVRQVKPRRWWNDGALFVYGFVRSNYVTAIEDWFMGLAGKLVNITLMVTILYSCAEIYMTLPQSMNATMFLIQMGALDIGGYGLATLARMAKRDGDNEGARKANWLGGGLIVVMLVSVMIAGLEQKITIPDGIKAGIDIALILIRSACSVFYGRVVHALKIDHNMATHNQPTTTAQPAQPTPQVDLQVMIQEALEKHAQDQKQTLDLLRVEQQHLLGKVQGIENSVPAIDYKELAKAMLPLIQGHITTTIAEIQSHPAALPEPEPLRQLEARATSQDHAQSHQPEPLSQSQDHAQSHQPESPAQSQGHAQSHQPELPAQSQNHRAGKPTLTLVNGSRPTTSEPDADAHGTPEKRLQAAYDKLVEEKQRVSGRALAKLAHVNRGTASAWLAESQGQQDEPDENNVVESDCVVEAIAQGQ